MAVTTGNITPEQFNNFGELLRFLRERAELSQREFALQVGYHYSYMSRIEKNERMPDSATLMARFVPALGLDDEPQWTERLLKLAASEEKTISPRRGQAAASHAPLVATSLPSFDSPISSLPLSLTPLLGREKEVETLTKIISRPDVRLVTLVGAPGVGKTRLAIHTANEIAGLFAHGAVFADLSPIAEPKDVLITLASTLGVQGSSDVPLMVQVISTLRHKNLLLVIDNFEHVIDASPQLVQLLGNAPQVKALVTSREALRISGEHEFTVEPLPVPGQGNDSGLIDYAAVQLFAQRAQAVDSNFRLTLENLKSISEICRRLDGLPLAIELAAARVKFITPQAMLSQFDRRLDWVAHGTRDAVSSRQTLRGAIEWSYNTLSDSERVLMRRLAVFSGGWNAQAAEAVCGDDDAEAKPNPILRRNEVLNLLIQLTDKSLVIAEKQQEETRFRFLETIHDFVREKLEASGEAVDMRNRHLAYFAKFAETMEANVDGVDQIRWTLISDQEHNNLRTALEWGVQADAQFMDSLKVAAAASLYWLARSYYREGVERVNAYLLRATEPEHQPFRVKLLYRGGAMAGYLFDFILGKRYCEQAVDIARKLGSKRDLANALFYLSEIDLNLGLVKETRAELEECISLCWETSYTAQLTISMTNLGVLINKEGDFQGAVTMLEEALAIANRTKDIWGIGHALISLGSINRFAHNYDAATDYFERGLDVMVKMGDRRAEGITHSNLALLYFIKEKYDKVGECAERAFAVFQAMGNEYQTPYPLRMMGYSAIRAGNVVRARVLIRESLIGNYGIADTVGQLACLIGFANCDVAEKDLKSAVMLSALAEAHCEKNNATFLEPDAIVVEDILKQCKKKLGKAAYESAYEEGQKLKLESTMARLMTE
jgi:predicted ATPase/transcriptional regulator with XRE-family HTH domain